MTPPHAGLWSLFICLALLPASCDSGASSAPSICTPGTRDCNGDRLMVCSDDGAVWDLAETCEFRCSGEACEACVPHCYNRDCGDDGCGGTCGPGCSDPTPVCGGDGRCLCVGSCDGRQCGDDGCGRSCGDCPLGEQCAEGSCECVPACEDRECGADGCGGECGSCTETAACVQGVCHERQCEDGNEDKWDGCYQGLITEFVLNERTEGDQLSPVVGALPDGRFVAGWQSENDQCGWTAAYFRVFGATGTPATDDTTVYSTTGAGLLCGPVEKHEDLALGVMGSHGFTIAWRAIVPDEDYVMASMMTSMGARKETNMIVEQIASSQLPAAAVAGFADGRAAVVWKCVRNNVERSLCGRLIGPDGSFEGDAFVLTEPAADQWFPGVAPAGLADIVVVWRESGVKGIVAPRDGSATGTAFKVQTSNAFAVFPSVATWSDGAFVVAWSERPDLRHKIMARTYSSNGTALGAPFQVCCDFEKDQGKDGVAVATAGDGTFTVVWAGNGETSYGGIWAQRVDRQGQNLGAPLRIDTLEPVLGVSMGTPQYPRVATGEDGGLVVIWQSYHSQPDGVGTQSDIFAQRLDASGSKIYR